MSSGLVRNRQTDSTPAPVSAFYCHPRGDNLTKKYQQARKNLRASEANRRPAVFRLFLTLRLGGPLPIFRGLVLVAEVKPEVRFRACTGHLDRHLGSGSVL